MSEMLPRAFFDITIDGEHIGRILFELRNDIVPLTCANFLMLCTGQRGNSQISGVPLHYKGCKFHRIIPKFMCQSGDFTEHDGHGGESIYGKYFKDENFELQHTDAGILSMANSGPDKNRSQFFITTSPCPTLDGKHVVFGKVIDGMNIVKEIEKCGTKKGTPTKEVIISDCGIIGQNGEILEKYHHKKKSEENKGCCKI